MSMRSVKPLVVEKPFPDSEPLGCVLVVLNAAPRLEVPLARRGDELPDREVVPELHVTAREAFVDVRTADQTFDRHDATEPLVGLVPNALTDPVIVAKEARSRRHRGDDDLRVLRRLHHRHDGEGRHR